MRLRKRIEDTSENNIFWITMTDLMTGLVLVFVVMFIKPSQKTLLIIIFSIIGLFIGLTLLKIVFPVHYETLINIPKLTKYADMHDGGYGISRINFRISKSTSIK